MQRVEQFKNISPRERQWSAADFYVSSHIKETLPRKISNLLPYNITLTLSTSTLNQFELLQS